MSAAGGYECFLLENKSLGLSSSGGSEGMKRLLDPGSVKKTGKEPKPTKPADKKPRREGPKKNAEKGKKELGSEAKEEGKGGCGGAAESDHEMHIWTERERRKKMRNMFSSLHALLPQLPPKADKSSIVDEAVNYIKALEETLQTLQNQRLERAQGALALNFDQALTLPNQPTLMVSSRESFLADHGSVVSTTLTPSSSSLSFPRTPVTFQTWTSSNVILNICGNSAQFSICSTKKPGLLTAIFYVLEKNNVEVLSAHVSSVRDTSTYMIQAQVSGVSNLESYPVEEIYKQAAGEITLWVSSF